MTPPAGQAADPSDAAGDDRRDGQPRPMVERLGLGIMAAVLAGVFGTLAWLALQGGEVFLGVMAGIGGLMTVWAAASSLRRD